MNQWTQEDASRYLEEAREQIIDQIEADVFCTWLDGIVQKMTVHRTARNSGYVYVGNVKRVARYCGRWKAY